MTSYLQLLVSGIATGAIYGLVAVGYSLTFMTTKTFNFGLGMWVMIGGMLTYEFCVRLGFPPVLGAVAIVGSMYAAGLVAARLSIQRFLRAGSELWVLSTLAIGLLLIDVAEIVWGRAQHSVPPYVGESPVRLWTLAVWPQHILVLVIAVLLYVWLNFFYRRTLLGKAFRAVARDSDAASLMGIDVPSVERTSYAASAAIAGLAGFLIVPITGAEPHLGTSLGFKSFAVAIIAGLGAPRGILVFGLIYGAFENLISAWFGTGLRDIMGFTSMIVVLYFRPAGLFGARSGERI